MADDGTKFTYFLAGIGIGTLIGILVAPKAGAETRELIVNKADEGRDYLKKKSRDVREQAEGYISKGKEAVQRQKQNLDAAIDAGKQAYREATSAPDTNPGGSQS